MFQHYSRRALQVIFATRVKAGLRGADSLDVGDLLFAFVTEDQSKFGDLMSHLHPGNGPIIGLEAHGSFLPADVASRVLGSLESALPHSSPVPTTQDLSLTSALQSVVEQAEALRSETGYAELEPLHLLAAIIQKGSASVTAELVNSGITYESVMEALNGQNGDR
jgi:hypothetical protein